MSTWIWPVRETMIMLIRHGETAWNLEGRWQGQADVPLSERGRMQARLLAARLEAEGQHVDHLYASDLRRAWETALLIAPVLKVPVQPLPTMREVHIGAWSGLTTPEIKERFGEDFGLAVQQGGKRGEHGESDHEFTTRIGSALVALAEKHRGERLFVVSHGAAIRVAVEHLTGPVDFQPEHIRNTSLTTLVFDGTAWHLHTLNDHQHLNESTVGAGTGRSI